MRAATTLAVGTILSTASSAALTPRARARGAFLGGLVGDSLALASHYEYDARVIAARVPGGTTTELMAPYINHGVGWGRAQYHPGKVAGDMTDAGDFSLMLAEYMAASPSTPFSFDGFVSHVEAEINDRGYGSCNFQSVGREATSCPPGTRPGYLNGGLRRTLEAVSRAPRGTTGAARQALAADVNCLVAATHWGALLSLGGRYAHDEGALVADAVSSVYLSHRNRDPLAAAAFLARAAHALVFRGEGLSAALSGAAAATGDAFISARLAEAVAKVAEARDPGSALSREGRFRDDAAITSLARLWDVGRSEPIKVGKASPTEGALPAALYFALLYEDSLERALVANADCGGDSGARALVIGTLLGALHGDGAVPARWAAALRSAPAAMRALDALEGADAHVAAEL